VHNKIDQLSPVDERTCCPETSLREIDYSRHSSDAFGSLYNCDMFTESNDIENDARSGLSLVPNYAS